MRAFASRRFPFVCIATVAVSAAVFSADVLRSPAFRDSAAHAPLRVGQPVRLLGDDDRTPWTVTRVPTSDRWGGFVGLRRGDERAMTAPGDVRPQ